MAIYQEVIMQQLEMYQRTICGSPAVESEERPWGKWTVLNEGVGYKVKLLEIAPRQRLSLQLHQHRTEYWFVISGTARVVIGERSMEIGPMRSVIVPVGTIHRIENPHAEYVTILEVQQGDKVIEDDIVRLHDDYNRLEIDGRKEQ